MGSLKAWIFLKKDEIIEFCREFAGSYMNPAVLPMITKSKSKMMGSFTIKPE
jgi:hypothetical protein